MLDLCANSAVLAEFHLRVNVRAPRVWNTPPANLQTWFINAFLLGLNAVQTGWLNCCLFLYCGCLFLLFPWMLSFKYICITDLIVHLEIHCHFNVVTLFFPYCIEEIDTWSAAISMRARTETHTNVPSHTPKGAHRKVTRGSTKPNEENPACATAMR